MDEFYDQHDLNDFIKALESFTERLKKASEICSDEGCHETIGRAFVELIQRIKQE